MPINIAARRVFVAEEYTETELAKAYNQAFMPDKAIEILMSHDFVPCEGGEHAIADQYMFAYLVKGKTELDNGNYQKAIEYLRKSHSGRATFLPVSSVKGKLFDNLNEISKCDGYIGVASDIGRNQGVNIILNMFFGSIANALTMAILCF